MSRQNNSKRQISRFTTSEKTVQARESALTLYRTKFFNIFMNGYVWKGLSYIQKEYVMSQFWEKGTVAVFNLEADKYASQNTGKSFAFAPYSTIWYNTYHFPISVFLVNTYAVSFIPSTEQIVDEDVVLGYAQHSHTSIQEIVEYYAQKIVEVDMTIRTNLMLLKMPWALKATPENEDRLRNIFEQLENDAPCIQLSSEDLDAIEAINTSTPYVIDKLYSYKIALENELLTILGIDNIGNVEKKERLITDEVNSNNDIINDFGDSVLDNLTAFCEKANELLGINISVKAKNTPVSAMAEAPKGGPKNGSSISK